MEPESKIPNPDRRNIVKGGVVVATGVALGALGTREVKVMEHGLETRVGTFFPLYERHDIGIEAKNLPSNLDAFFRELSLNEFYFDAPPARLLDTSGSYGEKTPQQENIPTTSSQTDLIKKDTLELLAQQGVRIAFGDISPIPGDSSYVREKYEEAARAELLRSGIRVAGGAGVAVAGVLLKCFGEVDEEMHRRKTFSGTTRRLLGKAMIAAGAGLAVPTVAYYSMGIAAAIANIDSGQKTAIMRIYNRLQAMVNHTRPESNFVFLRNLVMADKLLVLAEAMGEDSKKPRIAFNVGAGHAGIEDFLIAGHDFTRWLISHYPKWYLYSIIETTGGLEDFSSLRVFTLPKDIKKEDLNKYNLYDESSPSSQIQEERIVDGKLLADLKRLFAAEIKAQEEARDKVLGELRPVLQKHLSEGVYQQVSSALEQTKSLSAKDYKEHIRVNKSVGEGEFKGSPFRELELSLPDFPLHPDKFQRYDDIEVRTREKNGQVAYEEISFFVDENGQLAPNNHRADLIAIPPENLLPVIQSALKDAPKDNSLWEYSPPGTSAAPLLGQGAFNVNIKQNGVDKHFHISQDGHITLTVFYSFTP